MTTAAYNQVAEAMRRLKAMTCRYDGHQRTFCPIILGDTEGEEKVLVYQVGGRTSKGQLVRPEWKCFFISKMREIKFSDVPWQSGDLHRKAQTCVEEVDLDVNPSSPYAPKRKLET
jgi:hypothetical protein